MTARAGSLLEYLHRLLSQQSVAPAADAELLERFLHQRDEVAFTELVKRHGPMVQRVCRRVLADADAANDASQAVWLVFARKAATVKPPESLAAWLHGVAWRLAQKARVTECRRLARESPSPDLSPIDPHPDPLADLTARELLNALDEEVQRLPLAYRLPVILCCLEGHTQEEAARKLGWTPGSVKGRLERGRARLHAKLLRRGLTLSSVLAAAEVSRAAVGSATLTAETVKASLAFATHGAAGAGASVRVAMLAHGGLKAMALTKAKVGIVFLLAASVALAGTGLVARHIADAMEAKAAQHAAPQKPGPVANPRPPTGKNALAVDLHGDALPPGAIVRLGTTQLRHAGGWLLTFASAGKELVSVGEDHSVRIWNASSGRLLRKLPGPTWGLSYHIPVCSPDGSMLAVWRPDTRNIVVWDLSRSMEVGTVPYSGEHFPRNLAFSPDGHTLAVASTDGVIRFMDPATAKERREPVRLWKTPWSGRPSILFSPDGKTLATAEDGYGRVQLWDIATGKELWRVASKDQALAFSPDGKSLVTTGAWFKLTFLDPRTGQVLRTLSPPPADGFKRALDLKFSPDGTILAVGGDAPSVILWDVAAKKELHRLPAGLTVQILFSRDGKKVATSPRGTFQLWDVSSGNQINSRDGHRFPINALAYSPDGRLIVSAGDTDQAIIWDAVTGRELRTLPGHTSYIRSVAFTSDGRGIVSGCGDGKLRLFETTTGKQVREFSINGAKPEDAQQVWTMRLSVDGKKLAALGLSGEMLTDYTAWIWDIGTGKELVKRRLASTSGGVFSPDVKTLAIPRLDKLLLEDVDTGQRRQIQVEFPLADRLVFSLAGTHVAARCYLSSPNSRTGKLDDSQQAVELFDLKKGVQTLTLETGPVTEIAFSPDDRYLAATRKKDLCVFELASGREVLRRALPEQSSMATSFATAIAFAPDGRRLATGLFDTTTLVWDMTALAYSKDLARLWSDLAGPDDSRAYAALCTMEQRVTSEVVAFLKKQLPPAKSPDPQLLKKLLLDLDSDQFTVREAAARDLDALAEQAAPLVRQLLAGKPSLEVRKRLETSLSRAKLLRPGQTLRAVRAVEILERIGTAEAKQMLQELAGGAAEARLTQEAKAAVQRLAK